MSENPTATRPLVLCVEDEPQMRRFLRTAIESAGFRWLEADSGESGLRLAEEYVPDIVLLDLGLPDMEGIDVARQLRKWSRAAIIVLSARGQEQEKVSLLEAGADDYLTKPFGFPELVARMRAGTRRIARADSDSSSGTFVCGPMRIDFVARRVMLGDVEVHLTPIEFKLLGVLAAHSGQIVTKTQLLTEVWGPQRAGEAQYLRVYMTHLRRKLRLATSIFRTEAGVGYGLECPPESMD